MSRSAEEDQGWRRRAHAVALAAPSTPFTELVQLAGLDPTEDVKFADWSGVSFAGCDLRGYDLTGARLHGCDFAGARIAGARLDQAELDAVIYSATGDPHAPAQMRGSANLRAAADWQSYKSRWQPLGVRRPDTHVPGKIRPPDSHLPAGAVFQDAPFAPELVVLPTGHFEMRATGSNQARRTAIKRSILISQPIALGRYPVTFDEYEVFLKFVESRRSRTPNEANPEGWGRGNRPVINVSWEEALQYCAWLNQAIGLPPELGYRLPSEPEWEFACRAGTETRRWWGNDWDSTKANGKRSYEGGKTSPVGSSPPNPWGLYDMIGNVWELCGDQRLKHVLRLGKDDYSHRVETEFSRVLRGGSWFDVDGQLCSDNRNPDIADVRNINIGFRVARTLDCGSRL